MSSIFKELKQEEDKQNLRMRCAVNIFVSFVLYLLLNIFPPEECARSLLTGYDLHSSKHVQVVRYLLKDIDRFICISL